MIEEVNKIEQYLDKNAYPKVREKGEQLAKVIDNFGAPTIEIGIQQATFRIMGTYYYTVTIKNFLSEVKSQCTCPYDWGGLCKHETAALIYLSDYLKKNSNKIFTTPLQRSSIKKMMGKRNSADPYLIKEYSPLRAQIILDHTDPFNRNRPNSLSVSRFKHKNQTVHFDLFENSIYQRKSEKIYRTSFTKTDTGLIAICSCKSETEKLCVHQATSLWYILQVLGGDFFDILHPQYVENRIKEWSEKTGIPLEIINDYYDFDIQTRRFIPKPKAVGLVQFDEKQNHPIDLKLHPDALKSNSFMFPGSATVNERAVVPGYVFSFEDSSVVKIIPITGMPTDTPWLKYISEYNKKNVPLQWEDTDEEIMGLIHELDQIETETWKASRSPKLETGIQFHKQYFKKLQRIFSLMEGKEYLYYRTAEHSGKIKRSHIHPIQLSSIQAELFFELKEEDIFYTLESKLQLGEDVMNLSAPKLDIANALPFFSLVLHKDTLHLHRNLQQAYTLDELKADQPVFKCVRKDFDAFFEQIVKPLSKSYPVLLNQLKGMENVEITLEAQQKQLYITELSNFILFKPVVQYDHDMAINIREKHSPIRKEGQQIISYLRDLDLEEEYLNWLSELHPEFKKQQFSEFFFLPYTALTKNNWFFKVFEKFTEAGLEVFGINELKNIAYSPYKATINSHIKSGQDWFEVNLEISFGDEVIKLSEVRKAVMRNERFVKLSDGKMGLLPDAWFKRLQGFFRAGELEKGELKISKMKFSIIDELFEEIDDQQIIEELRHKRQKLKQFQSVEKTELPSEVTAELREYQIEGYNWLNFLDQFQWGGILADDMGLGKTLQILTFLQKQANERDQPNLVIVPTSLLFNWQNEIEKFAPQLRFLVHHGIERVTEHQEFKKYNLIITTYGLAANDLELFNRVAFNYIILDESQAIKNPTSKRYKAVCLLKGRNKLAMTGTPIENNTFDLYAQLNFLNPGFLGSQMAFKENFSKPIDGEGDSERAAELQRLIKPFVLRRTKEQVASELPPKVEDYLYCTMEPEQRKVYDAYRNRYRDYLLNKIEEDGLQRSKLFVLEGLLKLRQICDSPELLNDEEDYGKESIKIKELLSQITEKTGQHKILVFSQFVKMLKLIRHKLEAKGILYEYLDGQSSPKARENSVNNFQENDECRVFLISLKAGGTGLNLTAADYVYIVDPWWNPAVENQAIDRTHRIGQNKHIIAYRMICTDTVEEKIINYQKKKLKIASDIIHTDENFIKHLTKEDISELFR